MRGTAHLDPHAAMTEPARRGRPRIHPAGLSPSDRTDLWQQDLKRSGGHRLAVNFNRSAWRALQRMAAPGDRGPLLERLVLEEARRRRLPAD